MTGGDLRGVERRARPCSIGRRLAGALRSRRTARRCSAGSPVMERSISNRASMRFTTSSASGEIGQFGGGAVHLGLGTIQRGREGFQGGPRVG